MIDVFVRIIRTKHSFTPVHLVLLCNSRIRWVLECFSQVPRHASSIAVYFAPVSCLSVVSLFLFFCHSFSFCSRQSAFSDSRPESADYPFYVSIPIWWTSIFRSCCICETAKLFSQRPSIWVNILNVLCRHRSFRWFSVVRFISFTILHVV